MNATVETKAVQLSNPVLKVIYDFGTPEEFAELLDTVLNQFAETQEYLPSRGFSDTYYYMRSLRNAVKKLPNEEKTLEEPKYDIEPLIKLANSYDPLTLAQIFTTAQLYIWKYVALLHENNGKHDVEMEDVAADMQSFSEVFLQMAKQADKVSA